MQKRSLKNLQYMARIKYLVMKESWN